MRRTSTPNFKLWEPITLLRLSDHWKLLPICGSSPLYLLPIEKPPLVDMYGTPSWLAPRFGVMPYFGLDGSAQQLLAGTAEPQTLLTSCGTAEPQTLLTSCVF